MNKRALVTGATGFLGGHLIDRLIKSGHEVRCLARNKQKAERLERLGVDIVYADLSDTDGLKQATSGVNWVFHAAARVSDWGPWVEFYRDSVEGTLNILLAAEREAVDRFVFISSVGVYDRKFFGKGMPKIREDFPLTEGNDVDHYSKAKTLADKLVNEHRDLVGVTIVRPTTFYGPGDYPTLVPLVQFLSSPFGGWVDRFDPVIGMAYVTDVADFCILAAQSEIAAGRTYNIGPLEDVHLREFIGALFSHLGIGLPRRQIPYYLMSALVSTSSALARILPFTPPLTRDGLRFLTTFDQRPDLSCALEDLKWQPKVSLDEGTRRAAAWIREQAVL